MTQPRMNFAEDVILPRDTHVTEAPEVKRLSTQNAQILARLTRGPATNKELSGLSLKYTSRISDLRKAGYQVAVTDHDRGSGRTVYALIPQTERPAQQVSLF
jgi:hypothetical protein